MSAWGSLPSGWRETTLDELAGRDGLFTDGDWILSEDLRSGTEEVRLLQLGDIGIGRFLDKSSKWISRARADELNCTLLREGDVLISRMAHPIARACLVPHMSHPSITAVDVAIFRPDDAVISGAYLAFVLNSPVFRLLAEQQSSGTTRKRITRKKLGKLPLPLPPRGEQDAIVLGIRSHLDRVRVGEERIANARALLDRYQAAVLAKVLLPEPAADSTDESGQSLRDAALARRRQAWEDEQVAKHQRSGKFPSTDAWKARYPEPEAPARGRTDPPPRWAWATVDEIAEAVEYGSSAKTSADLAGVPVLRMGNIQDGRIRMDDLKYLPEDHDEFPDLLLKDGDVLFNRTNSPELVGKSAVYRNAGEAVGFASYLLRVRVSNAMLPEYLVYYINSPYGRAWIRSVVSQQVGQANVNGSKLKALTVPLPPRSQQRAICARISAQLDGVAALRAALVRTEMKTESLRDSVLHAAITRPSGSERDTPTPAAVNKRRAVLVGR